ncbi:MAG: hypothetical protein QOF62_2024 [Pyrinomonadaceae bacterium]|nr:hypothetical protein [Pyrinomonadaceae bacterium]
MRSSIGTRSLLLTAVAALLLTVASSSVTLAQGKGNGKGHGNGNGDWSNRIDRNRSTSIWRDTTGRNRNYTRQHNKKCGKFVNCHDARAGRIDGRGPRGTRVGNIDWRNRLRNRNTDTTNVWRNRNRRTVRRVYENR